MSEMIKVKEDIHRSPYDDWDSIRSFVYEVEKLIGEKVEMGCSDIRVECLPRYDDSVWFLCYQRPMTAKELEAKMKRAQKARESAKKQKEKKDAQEKELFEKLKKKWGLDNV